MILYHMILQIFFTMAEITIIISNLVCKCPKKLQSVSHRSERQDCGAAPWNLNYWPLAHKLLPLSYMHVATSCCMLLQVATSCHKLPQVAKSCCPCPTCMFTGTAVLPAYLHNPVFPDGVSEGSPHKLPLLLICILSPQTGSVRLICCIAPTQSRLSFSIGRTAAHLAKDQFWGNEPVVQKTCPTLNLLCRYVLALNISKPFLFTTIEYTDILHHTCKKRVMLRRRLFWPKKNCGKSA